MIRRFRTIVALAAAASILAAAPAGAQADDPALESYGAGASATALNLRLLGQDLTFSGTSAAVGSGPQAAADGQALTTPLFSTPGAPVSSTDGVQEGTDCLEVDLPAPLDVLGLDITCVETKAAVTGGEPLATSTSSEIVIEVAAGSLIPGTPALDDLVTTIRTDLLGGLFDALAPVTDTLTDLGIDLEGTVDGLLNNIQQGTVLARVTVAPTASAAGSNADDGVVASAVSNGAVVEVLPALGPLVKVTVGDSQSSVVRDPVTGAPTATGKAAVLDVQFANDLLSALQPVGDIVNDLLGATVDVLGCSPDNALAGIICFSVGTVNELSGAELAELGMDFGDGTVGRQSTVLDLQVLGLLPDALLELSIGQTQAAANAVPGEARAVPETPQQPQPEVRSNLPKTGGTPFDGMGGAVLALAIASAASGGFVLIRRLRPVA